MWGNRPDVPVAVVTNGQGTPQIATQYKMGRMYGYQTGESKHWHISFVSDLGYLKWYYHGGLVDQVDLGEPLARTVNRCNDLGGTWDEVWGYCQIENCPILVGLGRGAYRLTGVDDGVRFDPNGLGYTQSVSWTEPGSEAAFLALGHNGNGFIDDGSELCGSATRLRNGQRAANGFVALAELDSNRHARIDSQDQACERLVLWVDTNHDGVSQPEELFHLRDRGVTEVQLGCRETKRRDRYGNLYRFAGTALMMKRGMEHARTIGDVILVER